MTKISWIACMVAVQAAALANAAHTEETFTFEHVKQAAWKQTSHGLHNLQSGLKDMLHHENHKQDSSGRIRKPITFNKTQKQVPKEKLMTLKEYQSLTNRARRFMRTAGAPAEVRTTGEWYTEVGEYMTTEIYIGTPEQTAQVLLNTDNVVLTIRGQECSGSSTDCIPDGGSRPFYDKDASSTMSETEPGVVDGRSGDYGGYNSSGVYIGTGVWDKVCLESGDKCTTDFEFYRTTSFSSSFQDTDFGGQLGIGARNESNQSPDYMLLKQMVADGAISVAAVSLSLPKDENATSYVDFGSPDGDANSDAPTVLSAKNGVTNWQVPITGFKWTNKPDDTDEYALPVGDNYYAEIDIGRECMRLPERDLYYIKSTILSESNVEVYFSEDYYQPHQWRCADLDPSSLPGFSFLLDGNWMEVSPADYIKEIDDTGVMCGLCIDQSYSVSSLSSSYYIDTPATGAYTFGRRFLKDYYVTLDQDNDQVSFTALDGGARSAPQPGTTPTTEMPRGVSLVQHDPLGLVTVPLGLAIFSAGIWLFSRLYAYYILGDDKFVVFPWDPALLASQDYLSMVSF